MESQQEASERQPDQEQEATGGDAWSEVGEQLEALGKSLARAMRVTWENVESQRRLREVRRGVQAIVDDVGEAVREGVPARRPKKCAAAPRKPPA